MTLRVSDSEERLYTEKLNRTCIFSVQFYLRGKKKKVSMLHTKNITLIALIVPSDFQEQPLLCLLPRSVYQMFGCADQYMVPRKSRATSVFTVRTER